MATIGMGMVPVVFEHDDFKAAYLNPQKPQPNGRVEVFIA
jgi:hypothetical protein